MATTLLVSSWFAINEVDHGVICVTEPRCRRLIQANGFLIEGGDFDILFDSGMGVAKLRPVIEALSAKFMIVFTGHTHIDHFGSHPEFGEAEILGRPLDADALRRPGAKGLAFAARPPAPVDALPKAGIELTEFTTDAVPWAGYDTEAYGRIAVEPTRLVEEGAVIETRRSHFEVRHLPGHSPGSIALWEPEAGVLFSGDAIYDGVIVDTAPGSDVAAYQKTMIRLKSLPVRKVFGGHKEPMDLDRMVAIANQYLASSLVGVGA